MYEEQTLILIRAETIRLLNMLPRLSYGIKTPSPHLPLPLSAPCRWILGCSGRIAKTASGRPVMKIYDVASRGVAARRRATDACGRNWFSRGKNGVHNVQKRPASGRTDGRAKSNATKQQRTARVCDCGIHDIIPLGRNPPDVDKHYCWH